MKTNDLESVSLTAIEIATLEISSVSNKDTKKYHFEFFVKSKIHKPENTLFYAASVKVHDKENLDLHIGSLEILIRFEIKNGFDRLVKKVSDMSYNIDVKLDKKLTIISLDTLRGVAFSVFRGSRMQNIILPLIWENSLEKVPNDNKK